VSVMILFCKLSRTLIGGLFLVSCATLPSTETKDAQALHGSSLAAADALLKKASHLRTNEQTAAVFQLRAAEIAWKFIDTDGGRIPDIKQLNSEQKHALKILSRATEGIAPHFIGESPAREKNFTYAGFTYQVHRDDHQKLGTRSLALLESAKPAHLVKHALCKQWHTRDGAGAPFAPKWRRPTDPALQRFTTDRGFLDPITAILNLEPVQQGGGPRRISLTGYEPTFTSEIKLGQTHYPLAADFTAPIVEQIHDIDEFKIAITGLIYPGAINSKLFLVEPFDPERIPVLLVHGLNSHPRMWKNVINDLRVDPKLRGKYQFMLFYYPTGWPISYSAMRLRKELSAFNELFRPKKKMVIIGHSMGGLLARMQVIKPGRTIWDDELGSNASWLFDRLGSDHLLRRVALFEPNPRISREIYICTPHRGSGLADLSLTRQFIKILKLPTTITSALIDVPGNLIERGQFTSVAGLSPRNPLYKSLDKLPILTPHHTILGDRGKGNTPQSSDGVVPYWSSHLQSAQSEKIAPSDHGAFDDPQAILELRRILLLNAGINE
jgi:hypothetical protein